MTRNLGIDEKLKAVLPMIEGTAPIAGPQQRVTPSGAGWPEVVSVICDPGMPLWTRVALRFSRKGGEERHGNRSLCNVRT